MNRVLEFFEAQLTSYDNLVIRDSSDAASLAIASAQTLLDAADAGSPTAISIRTEGASLLAKSVIATGLGAGGLRDDAPEIAIHGGPSGNSSYVRAIQGFIAADLPNASFVSARGDNLDGAQWIAENMLADAPPLLRWGNEV